jgi:4-aminobutyrate aminotransferase-like enzyme
VLRVLVPLTASLELVDEGISILERALEESLR